MNINGLTLTPHITRPAMPLVMGLVTMVTMTRRQIKVALLGLLSHAT